MKEDRRSIGGVETAAQGPSCEVRARVTRAAALVLITVAALFTAYEGVERFWLPDAGPGLLHTLHLLRGGAAALLSAAVACWLLLKGARPLLAGPPGEREWSGCLGSSEKERIEHQSHWFIRMRWIAVLVAATSSFIAVKVSGLLPSVVWWPLVTAIALLAALNGLFTALARARALSRRLLLLQVHADLAVLAVLLHFSGGIENPFMLLTFFHVIISGILAGRAQCYGVAAFASVLLASLAWTESSGILAHYPLHPQERISEVVQPSTCGAAFAAGWVAIPCAFLFLTARFVTTIAGHARSHERRLEAMAERALAEHRLLEKALETTNAGLRLVGKDLRSRMVSGRWEDWFGIGADGSAGGRREDLPVLGTLSDGDARSTEVVLLGPGTNELPPRGAAFGGRVLQVTTAPIRDAAGAVAEVVQLARDVTEQKRAQLQVMEAGRLAAVGELAGHVAHEVNNPISIIGGKGRLLLADRRAEMSEAVAREVEKIVHCSDRVTRIARGLLSYSRPAAGRPGRLDIRSPVRKARSMIEERARTAGVEIEERLDAPLPPVSANAGEMEQVFLNLLLNALDAMPEGGKLTVEASRDGAPLPSGRPWIRVTVKDTGSGIPAENRQKIFEPFFSTKEEGKGTGLGLSICHGLVQAHGGDIHVESEPGKGSRFSIRLPAMEPAGEEVAIG